MFLGTFGEDDGEDFGVVGHVEWLALQSGFGVITEPVAGGVADDGVDVVVAVAAHGGPLQVSGPACRTLSSGRSFFKSGLQTVDRAAVIQNAAKMVLMLKT